MSLDGFGVGRAGCPCFLSPFSPLTETNPLIKRSGRKPESQLSKRSITILNTHTHTHNTEAAANGPGYPAMTLVIAGAKIKLGIMITQWELV